MIWIIIKVVFGIIILITTLNEAINSKNIIDKFIRTHYQLVTNFTKSRKIVFR